MRGIIKGEVIGEPKPADSRSLLRTAVDFVLGWILAVAALEGVRWCIQHVPGLRHIPLPDTSWTVIVPSVVISLAVACFARRHRGNRH